MTTEAACFDVVVKGHAADNSAILDDAFVGCFVLHTTHKNTTDPVTFLADNAAKAGDMTVDTKEGANVKARSAGTAIGSNETGPIEEEHNYCLLDEPTESKCEACEWTSNVGVYPAPDNTTESFLRTEKTNGKHRPTTRTLRT